MKNNIKITIAIPAYNAESTIEDAIISANVQDYPLREILVCDDGSTDKTIEKARALGARVIVNEKNIGIGKNLEKLMREAYGKYVVYLCADDLFVNSKVVSDVVRIFDNDSSIGVIGRYYYFFMEGKPGAIGVCRDKNILTSCCCPSGVALRRLDDIKGSNKIFVEMPTMVSQYLRKYRWTMLEYDTVAARFKPGYNTGNKESYYIESPTQNWIDLLGQNYQDFPMFIQLKNRAPKLLWREICLHVKNDKRVLWNVRFVFHVMVAIATPRWILKRLTNWYRHRIARRSARIIERGENV